MYIWSRLLTTTKMRDAGHPPPADAQQCRWAFPDTAGEVDSHRTHRTSQIAAEVIFWEQRAQVNITYGQGLFGSELPHKIHGNSRSESQG